MMKGQTKHLTGQVREALLALPDIVLMEALTQWLDGIDEQLLDWSDECRNALGYRIQSDETHKLYASAATRLLDIATSDLQVGWSYTVAAHGANAAQRVPPRMADFFVFDTLSGGAGYATQVGQHLESLLSRTQNILTSCPEQCERSCYRCLRTYTNRILHAHLDRHLSGMLLRSILDGQAPAILSIAQQAAQLDMLRQFLELAGLPCELRSR